VAAEAALMMAAARAGLAHVIKFGDIRALMRVEARTIAAVRFDVGLVPAGFPSPADDYLDNPLDLTSC
jgi:hypothetical protein